MYLHANAKLGLAGRLALVHAIDDGCSLMPHSSLGDRPPNSRVHNVCG